MHLILFIISLVLLSCGSSIASSNYKGCLKDDSCVPLQGGLMTIGDRVISWPEYPVKVFIDKDMPKKDVQDALEAVSIWNSHYTRRLFVVEIVYSGSMKRSTCGWVTVTKEDLSTKTYSEKVGKSLAAVTTFSMKDGAICSASILLGEHSVPGYRKAVLVHEFGHALGLAHDDNDPRSIMFPNVPAYTDREQYIMPDDVLLIQSLLDKTKSSSKIFYEWGNKCRK